MNIAVGEERSMAAEAQERLVERCVIDTVDI